MKKVKPFWAKQGSYFVLSTVTTLTAIVAAFIEIIVVAATAFSAEVNLWISSVLAMTIHTVVILLLSIREGYEKRAFSLQFHLWTGAVFVIWHGVLSWLCQCAWFSSGLLYSNISDVFCYYLRIVTVQGKGRPLLVNLISVLLGDLCVILPMAILGNWLGSRKYRREVEQMKNNHKTRTQQNKIDPNRKNTTEQIGGNTV